MKYFMPTKEEEEEEAQTSVFLPFYTTTYTTTNLTLCPRYYKEFPSYTIVATSSSSFSLGVNCIE